MPRKRHDDPEIAVGRRMAASRMERGLSQRTVARRARIDPSYLSRIETGKVHPTVGTAMRIAAALRISIGDLLGPSPPDLKDKPCPVSPGGHCFLDLLETGSGSKPAVAVPTFTARQVRILRRIAMVLPDSSPNLLTALEMLVSEIRSSRESART